MEPAAGVASIEHIQGFRKGNTEKLVNQTFVRADSHAPKIDEYLSWNMAVTPAATIPKASNTTPNTVAHFGNLHWL